MLVVAKPVMWTLESNRPRKTRSRYNDTLSCIGKSNGSVTMSQKIAVSFHCLLCDFLQKPHWGILTPVAGIRVKLRTNYMMISIAIVPSVAILLLDTHRERNFRYRPTLIHIQWVRLDGGVGLPAWQSTCAVCRSVSALASCRLFTCCIVMCGWSRSVSDEFVMWLTWQELAEDVRETLPSFSFRPMVQMLSKFLGFMNLTVDTALCFCVVHSLLLLLLKTSHLSWSAVYSWQLAQVLQARNQVGRSGRTTPRLSAKGPLSQVKESIRACNKIKIAITRIALFS